MYVCYIEKFENYKYKNKKKREKRNGKVFNVFFYFERYM